MSGEARSAWTLAELSAVINQRLDDIRTVVNGPLVNSGEQALSLATAYTELVGLSLYLGVPLDAGLHNYVAKKLHGWRPASMRYLTRDPFGG